jgi:HlyD family secretion protein
LGGFIGFYGIYIEIHNGLSPEDEIKIWNELKPPTIGV